MVQELKLPDSAYGGTEYAMLSDLLIYSHPDDLRDKIHLEYLKAGANILETNTFGASSLRLKDFDFSNMDLADFHNLPEGLDFHANDYDSLTHHFNIDGVKIARAAIDKYKKMPEYDGRPLFVAGSIGPSNWVLSSTQADLNKGDFEMIRKNFYDQVAALMEGGADIILFETQQDMLELKAAITGAKDAFKEKGFKLPIIAQPTVDQFCKMQIFNTDILAVYAAISGLGIDVFGINCTVGPELMDKVVPRMAEYSHLPISVVPNAGQPISVNGETVYPITPAKMAEYMKGFVENHGVNLIGGCCGTTPAHIRAMVDATRDIKRAERTPKKANLVSGPQVAVELDSSNGLICIGERLNARGSKKVRVAVEEAANIDYEALEEVVSEQVRDLGIDIIDVCMDSNIVETERVLPDVIYKMTADFQGVMCIDSFAVDALEASIDIYPGRPIVNSIALEEFAPGISKIDAIVPITQHHNPVYIALVTDGDGPALTADKKYELSLKIVEECAAYGVTPDQLMIDINGFPIGSESEEGMNFTLESLNSIERIKSIHPDIMTSIGVGNLTNGLAKKPYMRKALTSVFLDEARKRGLDAAILNPNHYVPAESLDRYDYDLCLKVIFERDLDAFAELEDIAERKKGNIVVRKTSYDDLPLEDQICEKIKDGFKERSAGTFVKGEFTYEYKDKIALSMATIVDNHEPLVFINDYLMVAMKALGDGFGRGEVSLPHLLKAADVMKHCMGFIETYMRNESGVKATDVIEYKGTIVLGTVYQDVHSIGKDLAKTLMENYGFRVIDLGVQVPLEDFIDTAVRENADAIGMSALLVQTSNHMITVQKMCNERGLDLPLLIGGAPVNTRHAAYVAMYGQDSYDDMNSKVFYCQSGMDGVNYMTALMDKVKRKELIEENGEKLKRFYRIAKEQAARSAEAADALVARKVDLTDHSHEILPYGLYDFNMRLADLKEEFDLRTLYGLNWDFGSKKAWKVKGVTEEYLNNLRDKWVADSEKNKWIEPTSRYGVFPAQVLEPGVVIVYDLNDHSKEAGRLTFNEVNGRKDKWYVTQYMHTVESGKMDMIELQISTCGHNSEPQIAEFREQGELESVFLLQGLSDRVAEDMAQQAHVDARRRCGVEKNFGCRFSPGYPAMEDIHNNKVIFELLKAHELGIELTGASEFVPTSTTGAVAIFHPKVSYS
ncbi:MAG: homocysteine S-methyltransferase family protein [Lentisphaeraceae bacterium]|nr:homocysteine S-methyltransferase family protein [Lentisphaeraceae bacterium]